MNKRKTKKQTLEDITKMWDAPVKIDGVKVSNEMLAEFLDWSLVNNSTDFETFSYLYKTGFFTEHPVTAKQLSDVVMSKERGVK